MIILCGTDNGDSIIGQNFRMPEGLTSFPFGNLEQHFELPLILLLRWAIC